jgi:hypothetical protein
MLVIAEAGMIPFSTWYISRAWTAPESAASAFPAVLFRRVPKAALFGARRVMFVAVERELTSPG